jgi:hypothetical protein
LLRNVDDNDDGVCVCDCECVLLGVDMYCKLMVVGVEDVNGDADVLFNDSFLLEFNPDDKEEERLGDLLDRDDGVEPSEVAAVFASCCINCITPSFANDCFNASLFPLTPCLLSSVSIISNARYCS